MAHWRSTNITRNPAVAGKFYSAKKEHLEKELINLFGMSPEGNSILLRALISPHAGYIYSGEIAASAFNQILQKANYKRVFILASSHQMFFNGASVYTHGNYKTPLGEVKVDTSLAKKLVAENPILNEKIEPHQFEHSLEVQLPFLQYKLGKNLCIVPIILGTQIPDDCRKIAEALKQYFTEENLFVISTDFSHYPEHHDAVKIDTITSNAIVSNRSDELLETLKRNKDKQIKNLATSLCGWTSVLTLMYLTENNPFEYKKIAYQNSGDVPIYGDNERVVGYHAIGVYSKNIEGFELTGYEQNYLLEVARYALEKHIKS